jgi:hypothetical protein
MDIVERLRNGDTTVKINADGSIKYIKDEAADEIERLRGALRTIDNLVPKTKEITDLPYWVAIVGDIAESALNGTWPAYGVMPESAKSFAGKYGDKIGDKSLTNEFEKIMSHLSEEGKEHWRKFIRQLIKELDNEQT